MEKLRMEQGRTRQATAQKILYFSLIILCSQDQIYICLSPKCFLTTIKCQINTATTLPLTERWNGNFVFINVHLADGIRALD